jgi:integrase
MSKRQGKHPDKELTAMKVRQSNKPGRYADGNGLYLVISNTGAKRWMLRTLVQGKRRDMGLGSVSLVGLAEARVLAAQNRKLARDGIDPIEERNKIQMRVPTFEEAARTVFEQSKSTWKNKKHAQQWINTLDAYAIPFIGNARIDQIKSADILRVLSPIWLTKPETARRVRQRIKMVFDWAQAAGFRSEENPVANIERGLPKQTSKPKHHAAMPFVDVPQFVARLRHDSSRGFMARRALEILILTATRTSEVLHASWSEIDFQTGLWTISAERMKAGVEHRIPLTPRTQLILKDLYEMGLGGSLVFPGAKVEKPMSNMVFTTMLKRMEVPYTAHGFRSSFRDWVAETTDYPNELAEMALAHAISNKVEAAYRRGDMLERRRKMMAAWECQATRTGDSSE